MASGFSLAVDVKLKQPHAPFNDLDENLHTTDSLHRIFTEEELAGYNGRNVTINNFFIIQSEQTEIIQYPRIFHSSQTFQSM